MDNKPKVTYNWKLDSDTVHQVLMECLFKPGEDTTDHVKGEGFRQHFGFHPGRLNTLKPAIAALCDQLPEQFKEGWSFLNACLTAEGTQWGEHANVDELLALGTATGKITILLERELWQVLPGGMPYFKVND